MAILQTANISVASSGANSIISGVAGKRICVWKILILNNAASAQTATITDGGGTRFVIPLPSSIGGGFFFSSDSGGGDPFYVWAAGNDAVISLANATSVNGGVWYSILG